MLRPNKSFKRFLCLIIQLLPAILMMSQSNTNKGGSTFPLTKIENLPSNFYLTRLENGLEVLAIEDNNVPLVTVEIVVRNGAFVQTPDLEGLAHLYEHMFFKANKDYPSQEQFLDRVNELGIVFNGTTSNERVNYFVTLNKSKLREGLEFVNSAIRYPLFLKEEMKKENVVVAGEFQRNESNPIFYLLKDMDKKLWGDQFARKNSIGRYEVILNATPEIMQDIKDRYYYPNNSMLVVAGACKHEEVFNMVKSTYGTWQASKFNVFEKYPVPDFKPISKSENFVTESEISQVPIYMKAFHGPDTRNDIQSTYAADVWGTIMGQKNSKLQKALVESGLVYQINCGYQTEKYTGPINFLMVPNPQKIKEAIEVLEQEIQRMKNPNYYTDEEIQSAKDMLQIQDIYAKEKTSEYIHLVTYWWASATLDYYSNYTSNIKKVKREDIINFINKYISDKKNITGILISPDMKKFANLDTYFKTK